MKTAASSSSKSQFPSHLASYVAIQDPSLYTPIDHASWRFILRISERFFSKHAHEKYVHGLEETGISIDRIPLISEMDEKLRRVGWRAIPVNGFIPPQVFMEFQSHGFLPIACEMRTLEHLAYTPAPDIVHEAAGHAPIIADPEYANYLKQFGEVAKLAIYSHHDMSVYRAIRALSDIKENPRSTPQEIEEAEKSLKKANLAVDFDSELTHLARLYWWTVEYGLIGDIKNPRIYGAGLLSSVGESYFCLSPKVKKIPLSAQCVHTSYDITRPQEQLFVTPDFLFLNKVLNDVSQTLAFNQDGPTGLKKALQAQALTTCVLDSGLQISGVLNQYDQGFLKFKGPTQLAYQNKELPNQGPGYHREGFSTPLGVEVSTQKPLHQLTLEEIVKINPLILKTPNGDEIQIKGVLDHPNPVLTKDGKLLVIKFKSCHIQRSSKASKETLYDPTWGPCDLACGLKVERVFGDAADREAYYQTIPPQQTDPALKIPKTNLTNENKPLNELYAKVRSLRDSNLNPLEVSKKLEEIFKKLDQDFPNDWLLRLELLELNKKYSLNAPWKPLCENKLNLFMQKDPGLGQMISRGLELL